MLLQLGDLFVCFFQQVFGKLSHLSYSNPESCIPNDEQQLMSEVIYFNLSLDLFTLVLNLYTLVRGHCGNCRITKSRGEPGARSGVFGAGVNSTVNDRRCISVILSAVGVNLCVPLQVIVLTTAKLAI